MREFFLMSNDMSTINHMKILTSVQLFSVHTKLKSFSSFRADFHGSSIFIPFRGIDHGDLCDWTTIFRVLGFHLNVPNLAVIARVHFNYATSYWEKNMQQLASHLHL